MMTVVKTSNVELRNKIIRQIGDLKSVREPTKAFEIASSQIMKSAGEEKSQDKGDPDLKRGYIPGRFSMRSKGPSRTADHSQAQADHLAARHMPTRIHAQLLERDASSVGVQITLPACARVQPTTGKTSEATQWSVSRTPTHTVGLEMRSF